MSWQPSLLKLQMIIFCLPIIKADVQAYMVGSHLTHMLEEWLLWGHTVTSYGYGYLILEQKTGLNQTCKCYSPSNNHICHASHPFTASPCEVHTVWVP